MVTGVVKAAGKEPCQERGLHRDQTFISLQFLIGTTKTMLKKKKRKKDEYDATVFRIQIQNLFTEGLPTGYPSPAMLATQPYQGLASRGATL